MKRSLFQLFQNLISNAIKFHGDEPPKIAVKAEKTVPSGSFNNR